jgi:hypothetical protein
VLAPDLARLMVEADLRRPSTHLDLRSVIPAPAR